MIKLIKIGYTDRWLVRPEALPIQPISNDDFMTRDAPHKSCLINWQLVAKETIDSLDWASYLMRSGFSAQECADKIEEVARQLEAALTHTRLLMEIQRDKTDMDAGAN